MVRDVLKRYGLILLGLFVYHNVALSNEGSLLKPHVTTAAPESPNRDWQEIGQRNRIATQFIRDRVETLFKNQANILFSSYVHKFTIGQFPLVKTFEEKLAQADNIPLFESSTIDGSQKKSCSVRVGVNLKNSNSKLEYSDETMAVGLYHHRTLSAVFGQEPLTENLIFRANKRWQEQQLKASIDIPVTAPYYRASLSQELSRSVSSTLSAQAPLRDSQTIKKLEINFAFVF